MDLVGACRGTYTTFGASLPLLNPAILSSTTMCWWRADVRLVVILL